MKLTDYERKLVYHSLMLKACRKLQSVSNIERRVKALDELKTKTETKNNINHDTIFYTPQHSRKRDK